MRWIVYPDLSEIGSVGPWLFAGDRMDLVGRVYVAILNRECRLVDVWGMAACVGDARHVAGELATRGWPRFGHILIGQSAQLLYIGVTGRMAGEGPEDASTRRAAIARSCLAANLDRPGFNEAYACLARFDYIRPWYGACLLDGRGRPVLDAREYDIRIDIPMVVGGEIGQ